MVAELTPENVRQSALDAGETDADLVVLPVPSADTSMVPMPEPEVRDAPDSGAIHWHTQLESGLAADEAAPGAPGAPDAAHP